MRTSSKMLGLLAATLMTASSFAATHNATAQAATTKRKTAKKVATKPVSSELQELREALASQQKMMEDQNRAIQQLQQELQRRDASTQQQMDALRQAQQTSSEAATKAAAAETAVGQSSESITKLQSDVADVKLNQQNSAISTQEDQKRLVAAEGVIGRFRWNGDVRVRYENFYQNFNGCTNCADRHRERIRLRFGFDSRLGEDFIAGIYMASGVVNDPTSTNETLTNVFEKKTIGFDRGFITYAPQAHKWLQLTGGKFPYTWNRTSVTFDPDLNPEGFSEKFSFDIKNPHLKNFTATGYQLLFNEVSKGPDSYAVGGQVASTWKFGRWTATPSYSLLNWHNASAILNEPFAVTQNLNGQTVTSGAPGTNVFINNTTGVFAPNGNTNLTVPVLNGAGLPVGSAGVTQLAYASRFLYSDFILNNQIKTPIDKLPINLLLEVEDNLNAVDNRSHAYYGDLSLGQTRNRGDYQFGYAWLRQERDSVISSFNESDQRSPTNVLQHRFYVLYKIRNNTTLSYTQWLGHKLDINLGAPAQPAGLAAGQREPNLKRAQVDVVYSF
jgi:hypothetical protein